MKQPPSYRVASAALLIITLAISCSATPPRDEWYTDHFPKQFGCDKPYCANR